MDLSLLPTLLLIFLIFFTFAFLWNLINLKFISGDRFKSLNFMSIFDGLSGNLIRFLFVLQEFKPYQYYNCWINILRYIPARLTILAVIFYILVSIWWNSNRTFQLILNSSVNFRLIKTYFPEHAMLLSLQGHLFCLAKQTSLLPWFQRWRSSCIS